MVSGGSGSTGGRATVGMGAAAGRKTASRDAAGEGVWIAGGAADATRAFVTGTAAWGASEPRAAAGGLPGGRPTALEGAATGML